MKWVNAQLKVGFIALHPIPDPTADTAVSVLTVSIKVLKLFDKVENE